MDAPSGPVDVAHANELERLRQRAYGPDADIAGDAAAAARLAELEARRRGQPTGLDTPGEATAIPRRADEARAGRSWHRRRGMLLVGIGVTSLALVAGYTAGVSRLVGPALTPTPSESSVARMPPVPDVFRQGLNPASPQEILFLVSIGSDADRPNDRHGALASLGIGLDQLRRYEDFDGLNIWSGESRYGMTCVFVAVPVQGIREGYGSEGCAPAGFDPFAELPRQGSSSFMRFVVKEDRVDVHVFDRVVGRTWSSD
jgi:hypothetical protein